MQDREEKNDYDFFVCYQVKKTITKFGREKCLWEKEKWGTKFEKEKGLK